MPDPAPQHDVSEAAALYAAGAMSREESTEFEARLRAGDPEARREFERVRRVGEALLQTAPPVTPEDRVRERLTALVGRGAGDASARDDAPAPARTLPIARWRTMAFAGWAAAAAAIVVAFLGWWPRLQGRPEVGTLADLRAIESDAGTIRLPLQAQGAFQHYGDVGEFIWSPNLQRGYLRVTSANFKPNNPDATKFQAWFFDQQRTADAGAPPVTGGLLASQSSYPRDEQGNVIILIRPELPIGSLDTFAISAEGPSGSTKPNLDNVVGLGKKGGG